MSELLKRTWAEVDLDKILKNYQAIRTYVRPQSKLMAIVKADAYGHGAPIIAKEFDAAGADWFGVSNIEEAEQIRNIGIQKPILILGFTPVQFAGKLIEQNITQSVFSKEYAKELNSAAQKAGGKVKIHIKLDTGMSRIGFVYHGEDDAEALVADVCAAAKLSNLVVDGVFTHFAVSDEPGNPYTQTQFDRFMRAIALLEKEGVHFPLRHCCNSAGLLNYPEMQLDMVRPGIILYGMTPSLGMPLPIKLLPTMKLKSVLFQEKWLAAGTPVSYGMTYKTPTRRRLGTLPIGYADGFVRALADKEDVLIRGKRARIVGRVCMDQCMADITEIQKVQSGDEVTIIGQDGEDEIPVEEIASNMNTINYEVTCLIGKRVPRVFFKGGEQVASLNYFLP